MPSVAVKLYSVFFKFLLKHRLQSRFQTPLDENGTSPSTSTSSSSSSSASFGSPFGVTSRPDEESLAPAKPSFTDSVATKDLHIDPFTSLSIRIFLPDSALLPPHDPSFKPSRIASRSPDSRPHDISRRNSYGPNSTASRPPPNSRRSSYGGVQDADAVAAAAAKQDAASYRGYSPSLENHQQSCRKLPIMLQFHGGGFFSGSNDSVANDFFCRRIAKLCDVIVIAVGYRLAPENRFPAAFDDGLKVLNWLGKQANLAECSKSLGNSRGGGGGGADLRRTDVHRHIADTFGASMIEPWLAAHGDPSRICRKGL
ncbi:hypothetical protein ACLOJK_008249 [Asimina triloba]